MGATTSQPVDTGKLSQWLNPHAVYDNMSTSTQPPKLSLPTASASSTASSSSTRTTPTPSSAADESHMSLDLFDEDEITPQPARRGAASACNTRYKDPMCAAFDRIAPPAVSDWLGKSDAQSADSILDSGMK